MLRHARRIVCTSCFSNYLVQTRPFVASRIVKNEYAVPSFDISNQMLTAYNSKGKVCVIQVHGQRSVAVYLQHVEQFVSFDANTGKMQAFPTRQVQVVDSWYILQIFIYFLGLWKLDNFHCMI